MKIVGVELKSSYTFPGPEWDQGDIVESIYSSASQEELPAVLLTPACDVAQGKVDVWTFVTLFPDTIVAKNLVAKDMANWNLSGPPSASQQKALAKTLDGLLTQRFPRYHWLPIPIGTTAGHVADFCYVTTIPVEEAKKSKRVASLRSSWREQLPARYAAYVSRVGTDDFSQLELKSEVERLVSSVLAADD